MSDSSRNLLIDFLDSRLKIFLFKSGSEEIFFTTIITLFTKDLSDCYF